CTHAGQNALNVSGLSNSHIRGLTLRNCAFSGVSNTTNTLNFVDNLSVTNVTINGKALPDTNPQPPPGTRLEAESATISQGVVESNHAGFSGTGFVNLDNAVGSYVQWSVNAASAGTATLTIRFANGTTANRPMSLSVNGGSASNVDFPATGAWTTWQSKTV